VKEGAVPRGDITSPHHPTPAGMTEGLGCRVQQGFGAEGFGCGFRAGDSVHREVAGGISEGESFNLTTFW